MNDNVKEYSDIESENICRIPYFYNDIRSWVQVKSPFWKDKEEVNMSEKKNIKDEWAPADVPYEKYNDLESKYNKLKENLLDITNMYLELKRSQNG